MDRIRCIAIVLLLGVPALADEVQPALHFDRQFLIAVRGDVQPPASPQGGWSVEVIASIPEEGLEEDGRKTGVKTWLLLTPPEGADDTIVPINAGRRVHPWNVTHEIIQGRADEVYGPLLRAAGVVDLQSIEEIEPSVAYELEPGFVKRLAAALDETESNGMEQVGRLLPVLHPSVSLLQWSAFAPAPCSQSGAASVCRNPSAQWPIPKTFSIAWHQGEAYTQLAAARDATFQFFETAPAVKIAHLDTGYYPVPDSLSPPKFNYARSRSFIPKDPCGPSGVDCFNGGFPNGHGPTTLSVLAGGRARVPKTENYAAFDDFLGGAPLAEVFSYRVSRSVVLVWPMYVARGIAEAVKNGADVISMSMGGAPSRLLRDEVNHAYDQGTAMFFATGDFVLTPTLGVPPLIEVPPHQMVYPARFLPTTPVAGMTAAGTSYGENLAPTFPLRDLASWFLRGSYGPTPLMQNRGVAGVSPNVTARYAARGCSRAAKNQFCENALELNFSGTSAATPQVAAAAALWLQKHRNEFTAAEWRGWRKTQSVYDALTSTATCKNVSRDQCAEYFGAGLLQAHKALGVRRPPSPVKRGPASIGIDWITILVALIGIDPNDPPPTGQAARLAVSALELEVLQLVMTSSTLRRILGRVLDGEQPSQEQVQQLRVALLKDSRASDYLKRAIRKRMH